MVRSSQLRRRIDQCLIVVFALTRIGEDGSRGSMLSSDIVEISSHSPDALQNLLNYY